MDVSIQEPTRVKGADGCRPDQLFGFWAVEPIRFQQMLEIVQSLDLEKIRAERVEAAKASIEDDFPEDDPLYVLRTDGIAMINVSGPLTKYPTSFQSMLGGTSMLKIREGLRAAVRDPNVLGIMLVVDSPGGTVAGTSDLYADVRAADAKKPVYAHVEDLAASGGLYAAIGARRITSNTNAEIGSIGTFMQVKDLSGAYAASGVKAYVISSAAPLKGAGAAGTEITEEQRLEWERRVKDLASVFVKHVAESRDMTPEEAQALHTGQCWVAEKALSLGLIDGVCTLDEALLRLRSEAMTAKTTTDLAVAMGLAEEAESRASNEKALRTAAEGQVTALTARVAELTARIAVLENPPAAVEPLAALLASATPEQRAALERIQADAASAESLRTTNRLATFVAKATEIGAGSKLPIKADALGAIFMRAEDGKLSAEDRGEIERVLKAASATSIVGNPIGSGLEGGVTAFDEATAKAKELVAKGEAKTVEQAVTLVFSRDKELYERHRAEQRS